MEYGFIVKFSHTELKKNDNLDNNGRLLFSTSLNNRDNRIAITWQ